MAVPPNITPETATLIPTLPYTDTLDTQDAPTNTDYPSTCAPDGFKAVWYTYTTGLNEVMLSVSCAPSAFADYIPMVSVWTGTLPSLTQLQIGAQEFCEDTGDGFFLYIPVTPLTTYFFQINDGAGAVVNGADLVFIVEPPPCGDAPSGSLIVNDDTDGFPAMVLNTAGAFVRAIADYPAGEFGDSVASGIYCVQDGEADTGIAILDSDLQVIANVDFGSSFRVLGIKSNRVDLFYVALQANPFVEDTPQVVKSLDLAGNILDTWTLPADSDHATGYAVTRDDTVFYYTRTQFDDTEAIHAYDLIGSAALPDLHAGFTGEFVHGTGDGFVAEDGTIIFGFSEAGAGGHGSKFRQFNPDGTVAQAYTMDTALQLNHYAFADDDPGSFWVWFFQGVSSTSLATFQRFAIADGSLLDEITDVPVVLTSGGSNSAVYSISNSCPLLITQADLSACGICAAVGITVQPISQTIDVLTQTTLSVTATGTAPLSYQWYQGESGDTSLPVGTDSSSYTTELLVSDTSFWVRVSNVCGEGSTADSNTADITVDVTPPDTGEEVTFPIRCVRRSPTVFSDGKRIRHLRLELDCMVGQGNAESPAPTMTLRTSDDNGSTWSSNRETSLGPVGSYLQKVRWFQLGASYNRTYELVFDAAVDICIVQAFLDVEGWDH